MYGMHLVLLKLKTGDINKKLKISRKILKLSKFIYILKLFQNYPFKRNINLKLNRIS